MNATTLAPADWREFFTNGGAITVRGAEKQYSFQVRSWVGSKGDTMHSVYYQRNAKSARSFGYLGMLDIASGGVRFTEKSPEGDTLRKAAGWTFCRLLNGLPTTGLSVWLCINCPRCGELLTNPDSIERGVGPICAEGGAY